MPDKIKKIDKIQKVNKSIKVGETHVKPNDPKAISEVINKLNEIIDIINKK